MQLNLRTLIEFYALAGVLLAAFSVVGLPVKLALSFWNRAVASAASTPLIGAAVLVIAAWWWYGWQGPIRPVPWLLLVMAVTATLVVCAVPATRRRLTVRPILDARRRSTAKLFAVCLVGMGGLFFVEQTQVFTRDHVTVLSLGNNDAADYANVSQHLLDERSDEIGHVPPYNFGGRAVGFPGGACAFLASAASFTGLDVWKVMEVSMFTVLVLGAYSLALLLRALAPGQDVLHGLVAVAGFGVMYVAYLTGQWFFAQLLGVAFTLTCIAVARTAVDQRSRSGWLIGLAALALLLQAGLWIYPHMVVLGTVTLLPVAAVSMASARAFLIRGLASGALFAAALLLAGGSAQGLASNAIDASRSLSDVDAGWALPGLLPTEMLGFQTAPGAAHGAQAAVVSGALIAGVVGAGIFAWARGWRRPVEALLVAITVTLGSYLLVYIREDGPSYRQWKWITYLLPLFVAAVLFVVIGVVDRLWAGVPSRSRALGGVLAFIALTVYLASPTSMGLTATTYSEVTLDQINLQSAPELRSIETVHVDAAPYWETMWLAYFLRDEVVTIESPTYWGTSQPQGEYWIQRNDSGAPEPGFAMVAVLNPTYRLVRTG